MLSTLDDMHSFYQALFETDRLLRPATRDVWFHRSEPVALAGSDGVSVFIYERAPLARIEMIVVSTIEDHPAPVIRRALEGLVGLAAAEDAGPRSGGRPPTEGMARVIHRFFNVLNQGDSLALRTFIEDGFTGGPDAPPLVQRVQRMLSIHDLLGILTISGMTQYPDGSVEVTAGSPRQASVTFTFETEGNPSIRIRSIGVRIGD